MEHLLKIIKADKKYRKQAIAESDSEDSEEAEIGQDDYDDDDCKFSIMSESSHVAAVHQELYEINKKLQNENQRLQEWDAKLQKKEEKLNDLSCELSDCSAELEGTVEREVKKQCQVVSEEFEMKIQNILEENKKTRKAYQVLKQSNEKFKTQISASNEKAKQDEDIKSSQKNRISNLQRKIEILQQQLKESTNKSLKAKHALPVNKEQEAKLTNIDGFFIDVFGTLLQWISEVCLHPRILNLVSMETRVQQNEHDVEVEMTNDRCIKVLISLPNLFDVLHSNVQLSVLNFIHWSLLHSQLTRSSQRYTRTATYRRIGDHVNQSLQATISTSKKPTRSTDAHTKIVSSLIILQTVTQADIIAQTFRYVNCELQQEKVKEIFLHYQGTKVIFGLFKLINKINLAFCTDILMVLAAESPYLQSFLASISSVEWIQAIVSAMKSSTTDVKIMEKLSLLLQRLSRIRANRPIFDVLQVKETVNDLSRACDEEFVQLNLRSLLINIQSKKTDKEKATVNLL